MIIYPAIDLLGGKCVRLTHGDFNQCKVYSEAPLSLAQSYEGVGATHLHVVDLEGSRTGRPVEKKVIETLVRQTQLKVQVGGGIRTLGQAQELFAIGVDRLVIGSLAVREPEALGRLLEEYGSDRITLALDMRLDQAGAAGATLAMDGWTNSAKDSPWHLLSTFRARSGTTILATDIGRDGALSGANAELYAHILSSYPGTQVMASGGVASLNDLRALAALSVYAVVIGKALYEGKFTLEDALKC